MRNEDIVLISVYLIIGILYFAIQLARWYYFMHKGNSFDEKGNKLDHPGGEIFAPYTEPDSFDPRSFCNFWSILFWSIAGPVLVILALACAIVIGHATYVAFIKYGFVVIIAPLLILSAIVTLYLGNRMHHKRKEQYQLKNKLQE